MVKWDPKSDTFYDFIMLKLVNFADETSTDTNTKEEEEISKGAEDWHEA